MRRTFDRTSEMSTAPEWTYRHAEVLRNHWWWRPGWKVGTRFYAWHITVDQQPAIHDLAAAYQAELSSVAGLDMIPARWLHLTMQGVGHVEDVSDGQVADMLGAARRRLGDLEPVTVRFQHPVIRPEAIALPPHPVSPIQEIRRAVRAAIGDTFGAGAVPERATGYQPHISLAYISVDQPARAVLDALNRVQAEPVDVTIGAVSLIKMHRDSRMYEWRTVETIPLGSSGTAAHSMGVRPMIEFGEKARQAIEDKGMTVRAAARAVNYDHAFLSRVLAGKQRPSRNLVEALDQLLDQQGKLVAAAVIW
jgi:2'-5' RNA ligase